MVHCLEKQSRSPKNKGETMQHLFTKRALMGFASLLLVVSLLVSPSGVGKVDAEGGNKTGYLPLVMNMGVGAAPSNSEIFSASTTWKYLDNGQTPGSGWLTASFDDRSWRSGAAPLGYGNGTVKTTVRYGANSEKKFPVTFFRKTFAVDNPSTVESLSINLLLDDGAVIFLNGKEVARRNMPSGSTSASTYASACIEKWEWTTVKIDRSALVKGANALAVAVHQCSASSSDIGFALGLAAQAATPVAPPPAQPTPVPTQPPATGGRAFYVSTNGSSSSDGSASRPWSLAFALSHPSALRAGDTVWVRGGTYTGQFTSKLKGASDAPITIRAYPGERAILRNSGGPVLDIYQTTYVNFWGLEITGSFSTRSPSRSESTYGIRTYQSGTSHNIKFINMIVHDTQAQGFGWWQAMTDSEVYGSLFYYNGTTQLDHGIYTTNASGTHAMVNNFFFDNASHGVHAYTESSSKALNNIYMEGNTLFNNGSIGYQTTKGTYGTYKRNILIGGTVRVNNATVTNNYTYYPGSSGASLNLGYAAGSSNSRVTNNYFAGGEMDLGGSQSGLSMTGNTIFAPAGLGGFSTSTFPNNTYVSSKPKTLTVFVRPNKYEPNRANITIYNWPRQNTVSIGADSLGGVAMKAGDRYELRNVQNYFSDVITGVYDGKAIQVPMTGRSVAQPMGLSFKPASTFPEFGAFVLISLGK
jgi:hypothetical protein